MSTENELVDVREAYCWNCPACGQLNFGELEVNKCTMDERESVLRRELELEDWQELPPNWEDEMIASSPDTVICQKCNGAFSVDYSEEEDDE